MLANESPPEIAIIDVSMPGIDGWTTLRKLRGLSQCRNLPVIMISGFTSDQITERLSNERSVRFLSKPFSKADLASCIAEAVPVTG